ncbi:MAG: hypothetical protein R8K48_02300 [Gallionella sp.]
MKMNDALKIFIVFRGCVKNVISMIICLLVAIIFSQPAYADENKPVILYIGDSHSVGSFGMQENALLRSVKGYRVATYAICGSAPLSWFLGAKTTCGYYISDTAGQEQRGWDASTPLIVNLLKEYQPRFTVVQLGANMYGYPLAQVKETAHQMAMAIVNSGSKCIWIGPPQARIQPAPALALLFRALRAAVGSTCLLFDSRKVTSYPDTGGDGIHFDSLGESGQHMAGSWAFYAFYAFRPLLMAKHKVVRSTLN